MDMITVPEWKHIPAGAKVWNGFANGYLSAPKERGYYVLYELVSDRNTHIGWRWEREVKGND